MGMIFNSANTLTILELLHIRYGKAAFNTPGQRQHDIGVLQGAGATHAKAVTLGIHLPAGQDGPWSNWLTNMDAGGFGQQIVTALINYLQDQNCEAVEFWVIESNGVSVQSFPPPPQNVNYFGVILVEAVSADNAIEWERVIRDRRQR